MPVVVEPQMFVGLVGDDEQVVGPRELGDVRQFGLVEDDAGRVVGAVEQKQAGVRGERC